VDVDVDVDADADVDVDVVGRFAFVDGVDGVQLVVVESTWV
jgi:hypothetical protein